MRSVAVLIQMLGVISLASAIHIMSRKHAYDTTQEGFLKAGPARTDKIEITLKNLLIATSSNPKAHLLKHRASHSATLTVKLVNNCGRPNIIAYISGLDDTGKVFFLSPNGEFVYPKSGEIRIPSEITEDITLHLGPQRQPLEVPLPPFIQSSRVYFADSDLRFFVVNMGEGDSLVQPSVTNLEDPNADVNWGFVELTYKNDSLYANISYIDFVGIVLGMILTEKDGGTQTTAGLVEDATSLYIANTEGKPVHVLSPGNRHDLDPQIFENYWDAYVDQVWNEYTAKDLIIHTQTSAGLVKCRVSDSQLLCDGSDRGFAKPNAKDISGCNSGPFALSGEDTSIHTAVVPRLCAAFVRSTLLLDGGENQSLYYTVNPTNHYSRIVHSYEVDGRCYAFPYDDVNPDGNEDASGVVSSTNAQSLAIYISAPPAYNHRY